MGSSPTLLNIIFGVCLGDRDGGQVSWINHSRLQSIWIDIDSSGTIFRILAVPLTFLRKFSEFGRGSVHQAGRSKTLLRVACRPYDTGTDIFDVIACGTENVQNALIFWSIVSSWVMSFAAQDFSLQDTRRLSVNW